VLKEIILNEGIECEFLQKGGGWDIFLTQEEFEIAKREVQLMREAGGYVESLKIFEGEAACGVLCLLCQGVNVGYWSQVLQGGNSHKRTSFVTALFFGYSSP
jgi:hypothetical protein